MREAGGGETEVAADSPLRHPWAGCGPQGWSLSDHGLVPVVRVGADKHQIGTGITCATEREIFDALGLEYKPPASREVDAVGGAGKVSGGAGRTQTRAKTPSATAEGGTWEDTTAFGRGTAASEKDEALTP